MTAFTIVLSASSAITPLPPISIAGTGSITGTLIDSLTFSPIDSAKVVLVHTYYTEIGALKTNHQDRIDSAATDVKGAFHFNSVDTLTASLVAYSSSYSLVATDSQYNTATISGFSVANGNATNENFGMFPINGDIVGTVTDSLTGYPIDSAKIVLNYTYYTTNGAVSLAHTIRKDSTVTDTNGKYHFLSVNALNMSVMPPSPSYWISATKIQYDTVKTGGFGIMNSNLRTENIVMPSLTGAIAGTVTDTVNKKAVAGAKVVLLLKTCSSGTASVCTASRKDSTVTDAQGNFAFADIAALLAILAKASAVIPVSTNSYVLEVSSPGYQTAESNVVAVVNKKVLMVNIGIAPVPSGVVPIVAKRKNILAHGMTTFYDMNGRIVWRGETVDGRIQIPASIPTKGIVLIAKVTNPEGISTSRVCRGLGK